MVKRTNLTLHPSAMAERPLITLGSPQPITPKKRGGMLDDLLAKFGSQSSAESATKLRRTSSQQDDKRTETMTNDGDSKRALRQQPPPKYAIPSPSATDSPEPAKQTRSKRTSTTRSARDSSSAKPARGEPESSEDELARSATKPKGNQRGSARIHAKHEELKMEKHKRDRERDNHLRRGTRDRKTRILESDTMPSPPPASRRKAPPPKKLDTARNRLRDDIAHKSKVKANNFLVANKDYFLPLLPKNNHISKLAATHDAQPIEQYEELQEQPEGVTATMKPYQLSGLSYLVHLYRNGFSGILGDEMGLGKTLQTLSLFQYLEELDRKNGVVSEENRPYLVICPLSVLNSWVNEAQRWVPELKVLRFHGAMGERARLKRVALGMEDLRGNETTQAKTRKASRKAGLKVSKMPTANESSSYKIIVTTYDTFASEQSWFKTSFVWRYVVLDEGHKIKSSITQISTALRNISAEYRLILTGTPLQNNLLEMWALLAWLYPDVFADNTETLFKESFDLNKGKVNRQTMDDARRLLELVMLRRMKDSPGVNLGLPPKEEILLYVPLTPMQRFWYTRLLTRVDNAMLNELFADGKNKEKAAIDQDRQEDQAVQLMEKMETGTIDGKGEWQETANIIQQSMEKEQTKAENGSEVKSAWQKLLNLVMQLRKCCSHPYLLPDAAPDPYYLGEHIIRASGKFILLEKLLRHTVLEQGKKVLIFSGFTRTLDFTEDLLSLISGQGQHFKFLRLDGSTARAKRNLDIRLFNQEKSDYKVMLLSTRAGGLGINLTSAQDVIFLDEDWNPQITLQAEARAHRIGQTKKVTIYKLCTQGTVEEQMMGRIRKKLYLSAKITESMRNIHSEKAVESKIKAGRPSLGDDMPQMDATQLKTLIRRGAQTLSHPDIDATEMVSWDLDTMMEKCRDKPADAIVSEAIHSEAEEEKWLSVMERVECAVFDGKRYQRELDQQSKKSKAAAHILPDTVTREDRRKGKNTTVMVDGFAISKESMNCGDWEAVPTMAGKDPRIAEPVREKRREFSHETHCLSCFEGEDVGDIIGCRSCPRGYHFDCLEPEYQVKVRGFAGFFCSQHFCCDCGKNTSDAGGLVFRCRWCPQAFCEDCLDWDKTDLIANNLKEFELLEEAPTTGGFYIKCPSCVVLCEENDEHRQWVKDREDDYKQEHDLWLQKRADDQRELEQRDKDIASRKQPGTIKSNQPAASLHATLPILSPNKHQTHIIIDDEDDDAASPPALTDTSLPTPALAGSRVSTPKLMEAPTVKGAKRVSENELLGETRMEKKARLDAKVWSLGDDPLLNV
ncbi:SNF2 family N-terminal domain-containing protein [Paraphoma chrysanthemicola]|uniref:SNF2 family N-terminal domain-containing protein n=1 Tax=Paraphoma chrysanthemicola TaxID=798071 RepID=A0A8K0R9X4_9PLEO|nr:SNF2 family N-terminal domain-containing protein [Paraphoma chrysanthemicola]